MTVQIEHSQERLYKKNPLCEQGAEADDGRQGTPEAISKQGSLMGQSGAVVNIDSEQSLIVLRASSGSTDLSLGDGQFSTSAAVGAFEIEDLLVGQKCPDHSYLARSFMVTSARSALRLSLQTMLRPHDSPLWRCFDMMSFHELSFHVVLSLEMDSLNKFRPSANHHCRRWGNV